VRTGQGGLDSHHVEALDFDPGSQDDVVAHVATFNSDEVGPSRLEAAVYDVEIAVGVVDLGLIYRYDEHKAPTFALGVQITGLDIPAIRPLDAEALGRRVAGRSIKPVAKQHGEE
jgi:hypothetical protein